MMILTWKSTHTHTHTHTHPGIRDGASQECRLAEACANFRPDPLALGGNASGGYLLILTCQSVVFLILLALSEHNVCDKLQHFLAHYRSWNTRHGETNKLSYHPHLEQDPLFKHDD